MTPLFRFLRRVRIHGGESGAVARALHHEAKIQSLPAVGGNVSSTTNERKSMSTKTSLLKRIAQTAVVALLGGLFSTLVAAPSANAASNSSISATCTARAGLGASIVVTANGDNAQLVYATQSSATLATESATSSVTLAAQVHSVSLETLSTATGIMVDGDIIIKKYATITYLVWLDNLANDTNNATPRTTPNGDIAADPYTTVVCNVAGAPASFTLSSASASVGANESATFTITPKDAAGNSTLLASNETITVTSSLTTAKISSGKQTLSTTGAVTGYAVGALLPVVNDAQYISGQETVISPLANVVQGASRNCTGSSTAACSISLGANNADAVSNGIVDTPDIQNTKESMTGTGAFTVNVANTAAATTTFTIRGSGTVPFISVAAATYTLTTVAYAYGACFGVGSIAAVGSAGGDAVAGAGIIDGNQLAPANNPDKTGTAAACLSGGLDKTGIASDSYTVSTAKKAVTITWQLSAAGTLPVTVAAVSTTSSTPAGITAETVSLYSGTDTHTSLTLTATAPVSGQSYKVTWNSSQGVARTLTLTYADPVVNGSNGSVTLSPASGKALTGGTVAVDALVRDQFRSLVNNATVLFSSTGRNATTSAVAKTTNASGIASYSFVDDGTPATTLTDTVNATAQTSGAPTSATATGVTFTWTASLAVGVLRVTNDADADGVAVDGAVTFTATATDASGVALSGYPVTFTGDAKTYQSATANSIVAYTSTSGVATATFDGKTVGTATVTVTSGGKTTTSDFDILAGSARTVSLDASAASMAAGTSKRITATVKDRYGNGIEDAEVTVTYVGTAGRVASVNGIAASTGTADADGKVVIEVASDAATGVGTGTLTVKFSGGNTSTATVNDDGSALAARVATTSAAITITKADTSATDASTAAAEAATDAAAEAIDAANAATDAANLAAEAADAATVAAEEARDAADAATAAVEELATQVATLMAALKAQITTLANTVAKIAKKVKA